MRKKLENILADDAAAKKFADEDVDMEGAAEDVVVEDPLRRRGQGQAASRNTRNLLQVQRAAKPKAAAKPRSAPISKALDMAALEAKNTNQAAT